jgi:protein SCO1/2
MTVFLRAALMALPLLMMPAAQAAPAFKAGVFEPPRAAPEFLLRGSDGVDLSLARYRGKLVLMSFGFTHCAAVCPVTLATLAQARQSLGAQAAAVQVVFVTVDPERDDAAQMKTYLAGFDPSFVGGAGKPEVLAAMRKDYGVVATKVPMPSGGYAVDHTSSIFLIDRGGKLRAMMPYGRDARDYVHDIKLLLAQ